MKTLFWSLVALFAVVILVAASPPSDGCLLLCAKTPTEVASETPTSTDEPTVTATFVSPTATPTVVVRTDTPVPTSTEPPPIETGTITSTPKPRSPTKTPTKTILYWTPTPKVVEGECPCPCPPECTPYPDGPLEGYPAFYVSHIEDQTCILHIPSGNIECFCTCTCCTEWICP